MKIIKHLLLATVVMVLPLAQAAQKPVSGITDNRIKSLEYNPADVYQVTTTIGVATTIVFAPGESYIKHFSGNGAAFEMVPVENLVTFKPKFIGARSNLTILTNVGRIYQLEVDSLLEKDAKNKYELTYQLNFNYADGTSSSIEEHLAKLAERERENAEALKPSLSRIDADGIYVKPSDLDFSWLFAGDPEIAPIVAFDDGVFTYLQFSKSSAIPAIFAVNRDRTEVSINTHIENNFVVIEGLYDELSLRVGDLHVSLTNIEARKWENQRVQATAEPGSSRYGDMYE